MNDFANCTQCHRSGDEHEAERIWKNLRKKNSGKDKRFYKDKKSRKDKRHHDDDDDDNDDED